MWLSDVFQQRIDDDKHIVSFLNRELRRCGLYWLEKRQQFELSVCVSQLFHQTVQTSHVRMKHVLTTFLTGINQKKQTQGSNVFTFF